MEPKYVLMLTHYIYYCVMLVIERSDKGPKGPGDGILVLVVT